MPVVERELADAAVRHERHLANQHLTHLAYRRDYQPPAFATALRQAVDSRQFIRAAEHTGLIGSGAAQGFYFRRPGTAEDTAHWMTRPIAFD